VAGATQELGPVAQLRAGRLGRRVPQLAVGLVLYGVSLAMMVRARIGLAPWDVLHSGIARLVPLDLGQVVVVMSFVVLLAWIPLREVPGLGTIANSLVVGFSADGTLAVLPDAHTMWLKVPLMLGGVVLCAAATAMYMGSRFGRGPRDGLMTGLARRTGLSVRVVRTAIEVSVVALGWAIGGSVGVGTVVYALAIGPLVQPMLPWFEVELRRPGSALAGDQH
jgi:uncharacterized membrane protein YczE